MRRSGKKPRKGLLLPWEGHSHWLREAFSGRRPHLLVALAGLLLMVSLLWRSADRRARQRATRLAIVATEQASEAFRARYGRCPQSLRELRRPAAMGSPLLTQPPVDGWGRQLWLLCPSPRDGQRSEAMSAGPSGSFFDGDNVW